MCVCVPGRAVGVCVCTWENGRCSLVLEVDELILHRELTLFHSPPSLVPMPTHGLLQINSYGKGQTRKFDGYSTLRLSLVDMINYCCHIPLLYCA